MFFFFMEGLFSTLAAMLLFIFSVEDISPRLSASQSCAFWFYLILLGVAIVSFVFYVGVASWYKNRERGDPVHFIDSYTNSFYAATIDLL